MDTVRNVMMTSRVRPLHITIISDRINPWVYRLHFAPSGEDEGGQPRFEFLFHVWTNPLLPSLRTHVYWVYSERCCRLRCWTQSRALRSSLSAGCHSHRRGCSAPATCPHKPDWRSCKENLMCSLAFSEFDWEFFSLVALLVISQKGLFYMFKELL